MTSTLSIASSSSNYSSASEGSSNLNLNIPPSPASISSSRSASSSKHSLDCDDEENITITSNRTLSKNPGKQKSQDDLRLLAISTHMTELSYAISDIQTRIFEIQELRHKSQSQSSSSSTENNASTTTAIIDQSLMALDAKLESVEKGIKHVNSTLEPLLKISATPTVSETTGPSENAALLRKHAALQGEWEAVQNESDVLREELKEDKWLTVFRTVTDQADGMMSSLEKAVNRCQDFIWQVHRRGGGGDELQASRTEKAPVTVETFNSLLESFEAKKKHYMPATSKVLSIIDRGVRDRVTKNGETLRRHAESAQRWKTLRERIARTDSEMESVRKLLLSGDAASSENESSTSGHASSRSGYLATPPSASGSRPSRGPSSASITLSRSISPFRKFARKFTGGNRASSSPTAATPLAVNKKNGKAPSSEPPPVTNVIRRQRTSLFASVRGSEPTTPITPDRPSHKYSQSVTPESSPRINKIDDANKSLVKSSSSLAKQPWNSSTKVRQEDQSGTIKATPPRRPPSAAGLYRSQGDIPPVPPIGTPYRRSLSRASMASSRPWSPLSSSISTTYSSQNHPPMPLNIHPPSRAQTPSRAVTPGLSTTPRPRPKTPSHIPTPSKNLRSVSGGTRSEANWNGKGDDDYSPTNGPRPSHLTRSFSPALSMSALSSSGGYGNAYHLPRPPSRSMIPVPSVHLSSPSRPGSAMSSYSRSESPTMRAFRASAMRAQTPESALKARVQQMSLYVGNGNGTTPSRGGATRPSIGISTKLPPSSFRDGSVTNSASNTNPGSSSRPPSRTGAFTPTHMMMDSSTHLPLHEYIVGNPKDPLDVEFAIVANSVAHGMLIERVDPPLKKIPKEGEEVKAQYAFSNALSRKVVTCRLTTLTRLGKGEGSTTTKKVMCRVGGGWQDLSHYILNRQAGL